MIQNRLRPGTRVRLKTRRCDNWRDRWRSEGTIVEVRATTAVALMDDHPVWKAAGMTGTRARSRRRTTTGRSCGTRSPTPTMLRRSGRYSR